MSIFEKLTFDGKKITGSVDYGGALHGENELATNILMFMAVSINSNWKIPLGYFCVKSVNSEGDFFYTLCS